MHSEIPLSPEVWERLPPEAQAYIRALEARVGVLEETVQRLQAAIQQWEATVHQVREQLQQNSRTASRPPSSDPPQVLGQRPRREPSGRRPGGQPGHEGQTRALLPVEEVDAVIPVKPERCPRCQHPLQGADPQPQRHQVPEIPPVEPVVTEYQLHRLVCPMCGEATRAEVPVGVPAGGFGPRVQAITALCTGAYHLSKRTTQTVLEDLFGVSMGLGTVANLEQATAQVLAEPVAAARAYVQAQPTADLDETGWREKQQRAWLWAAVTAGVTVFVMRLSRGGKVAQGFCRKVRFLGKIPKSGIMNSMVYRCQHSRKSNFATEPPNARAPRCSAYLVQFLQHYLVTHKFFLLLLLVAVLGATLRLYALAERSLWLDEALSVQFASQSMATIVMNTTDPHPPLYYMLLHAWVRCFGTSEPALRSLSVVFGTVGIILIGLLGFLLYDRRTGLFAACCMAVMILPLHYAREARGYSVFLVMTLGSFYFCLKSLRGGGKGDWLGYFFFTVGLCYTHHYWVFLVLAQHLYVLLFYRTEKALLIRWTGIHVCVGLSFLPRLISLLQQTGRVMQEGFWISRPGMADLMNTVSRYFTTLDYRLIVWGYLLLCALGVVQLRAVGGIWRWQAIRHSLASYRWEIYCDNGQRSSFLLLWFICSVLVPWLLSQFFTPIFLLRYTIGAIPALYLLLGRGVWQVPTKFLRGLVITAIALVSCVSLQHYYAPAGVGRSWNYEPWREWVTFLRQWVEPADTILLSPPYCTVPFDYYAKDSLAYHTLPAVVNEENHKSVLRAIETLTHRKRRAWFVFRQSPSQRGMSTVDLLRDRYQEIAIEPAVNARSNLTVLLFNLTQ